MQVSTDDRKKDCGLVTATKLLGNEGEEAACRYLLARGYRILERNVRCARGEIDIIAEDRRERMLVFVEVKTRAKNSDAYPIHTALTKRKRRALRRSVARWVTRKNYEGPGRIDLLSVHQNIVIEHLQNIGSDFY